MNQGKTYVDCFQCQHFYVTWEPQYPRGCRNYNFKTNTMPSLKVYQAVGQACPGFTPKKTD